MEHVNITGIGPVLCCGEGIEALKEALASGFNCPVPRATTNGLEAFVAPKLSRRMDTLTRLALLSTYLAIKDAGLTIDDHFKSTTGIVFGSSLGSQGSTFAYLDSLIDGGDHCASSINFTNSVHNIAPAQVSLNLGIRGPLRTISAFGYTAGAALLTASHWIRHHIVPRVVLILAEDSCRVFDYSMEKMGTPISFPGGEGCVAFVLEGKDTKENGYALLGEVAINLSPTEVTTRASHFQKLFCGHTLKNGTFEPYFPVRGSFYPALGVALAKAALALQAPEPPYLDHVAAAAVIAPQRMTLVELTKLA